MNTIAASEIKRRGISALEEQLKIGPVHIIKNNRPSYVVLTENAFQELINASSKNTPKLSLDYMLHKPATGVKTRKQIDTWLKQERENWGD